MEKINTLKFDLEIEKKVSSDDYIFKIKTYIIDLTEVNGFKYLVELNDTELKLIPINLTYRWKFYIFWLIFICFFGLPIIPMALSDENFLFVFLILTMILGGLAIMYVTYRIEREKALKYLRLKSTLFKNL